MVDLSDTPLAMRSRLDASLARRGQTVTLRRRVGTSTTVFVTVTLRARVTGYTTDDLVAGIKVSDSKFITSPTPILAASATWPGAAGGITGIQIGDELVVGGRTRRVAQCDNVSIGDVWVRSEGRVS